MVYPMPVFIIATYGENGVANAMNAAWGGMHTDDRIGLCLSEEHKTTKNILAKRAFTVSMATAETVAECDYVGIESGFDVPDKIQRCGFHAIPAEQVDAPIFEELPFALECRVKSYDPDTCRLFGDIINISADESVLTDGKVDLAKLRPITYDPISHGYYVLGEKVGQAFADGERLK